MRSLALAFASLSIFAACSPSLPAVPIDDSGTSTDSPSGGAGSATVSGTMAGKTLAPMDVIALKGVYDSSYPGIVTIVIGNQPNLCATYQKMVNAGNASKANLQDFGFSLGQTIGTSTVVVGTYTPSSQPNELDSIGWDFYDATCTATHSPGTTAATVTLTSVGATYAGSFDATFTGGDHVTGTFTAPLCELTTPDAAALGDGGAVCLP